MTDYGSWKPTNFRYLTGEMLDAGTGPALLGGIVTRLAAAATIKFGQVVQIGPTTAGRVLTDTNTLYNTVGVAVGGLATDGEVLTDSALVESTVVAANVGDMVLVQRSGIVQVALDTDDIAIGDLVIPSAVTAGRVGKGTAGYTAPVSGSTTMTGGSATGAAIVGNAPAVPVIGFSQTTETVAGNPIVLLLKGLI